MTTFFLIIYLVTGQPVYFGEYQTERMCQDTYDKVAAGIDKKINARGFDCLPSGKPKVSK